MKRLLRAADSALTCIVFVNSFLRAPEKTKAKGKIAMYCMFIEFACGGKKAKGKAKSGGKPRF